MKDLQDLTTGEAAAWRAGWAAARDAAAREIDCGCAPARKAQAAGNTPNGGLRWLACSEANCAAIEAAAIRAMEPPA